jgi:hypothetical protein
MNRWMFRSLLLVLTVGLLVPVVRAGDEKDNAFVCSNRTIKGTYAFRVYGEVFASPAPPAVINLYRDGIAMTTFDGKTDYKGEGSLSQEDYILGNGVFAAPDSSDQSPNDFNTNETGTYRVFPDCTGQAEIDFPYTVNTTPAPIPHVIKLKFVIAKHGEILHAIVSYLELLTPANTTTVANVNIHSDAERVGDDK